MTRVTHILSPFPRRLVEKFSKKKRKRIEYQSADKPSKKLRTERISEVKSTRIALEVERNCSFHAVTINVLDVWAGYWAFWVLYKTYGRAKKCLYIQTSDHKKFRVMFPKFTRKKLKLAI